MTFGLSYWEVRDRSLFLGWGGLVQIGGESMIFVQGKKGAHKFIHTH